MGQIFYASAYDIQSKKCYVVCADKFHANCYSYSGAVLSIHYLLRQQAYRVMWGGDYVVGDDFLEEVSEEEDLIGLSTYRSFEDFNMCHENLHEKPYYEKAKRIGIYHDEWERLSVYDKAIEYFNWDQTKSVRYSGYLVNHTKKLAVDLGDYALKSISSFSDTSNIMLIDLVPILTETGGGTEMALFDGLAADTTEQLAGTWCGDLLQIIDELPNDYTIIACCFAHAWRRAYFCYQLFGTDQEGYILQDRKQSRYKVCNMMITGERGYERPVRVKAEDNKLSFIAKYEEST